MLMLVFTFFCYNWFWKSLKSASKKIATDKIPMNILHCSALERFGAKVVALETLHLSGLRHLWNFSDSHSFLNDQLPVNRLKWVGRQGASADVSIKAPPLQCLVQIFQVAILKGGKGYLTIDETLAAAEQMASPDHSPANIIIDSWAW